MNDSSKNCKTQSTLHSFSQVCPLEHATVITKRIAEFVTWYLHPISVVDGQGFLYENLVGGAVFILQFALHLGYPDLENPHPLQPYSQSHVYNSDTDSNS